MRATVVLCVALVTLWLGVSAHHGDMDQHDDDQMKEELKARMKKNSRSMLRLTAGIVNAYDKVKAREDNKKSADLKSKGMLHKLDDLFEHHCNDKQFSCQDTTQGECVSLLVCCDGVADCPNSEDESDAICKPKYQPGDTWSGRFEYYNCNNEVLTDVKFKLQEIGNVVGNTGSTKIKGMLFWVDETRPSVKMYEQMPYEGIYHYGSMTGDFRVNYSGQTYNEKLYFTPGEGDVMHYDIYASNTNEICGRAYMMYDH